MLDRITDRILNPFRRWRPNAEADAIKREFRESVARHAANGEARKALAENLSLMGIDIASKERPRLVGIRGKRFAGR
ncbi:hypothetical protein OPIT5_10085 [Opitutaceae bacterium TAV5]|nr:hypothetical protein OPIT5_10085 [Opitutaceae bacterium TAV5]